MKYLFALLILSTSFCQLCGQSSEIYPASTAQDQGVSAETLSKLDQLVQGLVDDEEVVGAEVLVIKNGHSILHSAYGWRNRELQIAMDLNSVFCVRSMTKPLIGTSILMLVDDGKIKLEDRVAQYLPSFEAESTRNITIAQLLSHTSGMPMSQIMAADLSTIDGIQAVAEMGAGMELMFEPGSDFNYSDQGTDTLTAIMEVVTGKAPEEFVNARILTPLGMKDSTCMMEEGHPLRLRGASKYSGAKSAWTPFWSTEKPPLFPFFLGSQGLYSTVSDYARFMELWMHQGMLGEQRLLNPRLIQAALTPSPFEKGLTSGIPGSRVDYGYLMTLWAQEDQLIGFGHNGSDGTYAWAFPEQNAMAFFFTQSRGTLTGMRVEKVLGELFLGVEAEEEHVTPELEQFLGYYWEGEDDSYRAVVRDGKDLAMELHGRGVFALDYLGDDRWQFRQNPSEVITFDRSDDGKVTGFSLGDHHEYRFTPSSELPSAADLAALIAKTHRMDLMESLGPMQAVGEIDLETLNMKGDLHTSYAWPDQFRIDVTMNAQSESSVFDGKHAYYASTATPAERLDGLRGAEIRLDNHFARFGDWHQWHSKLEVIQKLERGDKEIFLMRTGDASAPASTYFVDANSGRVIGEDRVSLMPGMGMIGMRMRFADFRDVSGMLLPYKTQTKFSNPMIGTAWTTISEIELGVELPVNAFHLIDN